MPSESNHKDNSSPTHDGGAAEYAVRTRKRKSDVVIYLRDPDEDVTKTEIMKKQNEIQPSSNSDACTLPHMLIPTPDKEEELRSPKLSFMHQSFTAARGSPLPVLGWANRDEVWKNMINKEQVYVRDKLYMQRHPLLQPKMRVILLDWLMEEIYPPKLHQFAYVTDGACTEEEILSMELIIMKALSWNLSPLTVVSWLNIYLQVAYLNEIYEMLLPQYPQQIFVQIAELLDLCVLDVGCLEYTYSILAASALYHFSSCELMQRVSGYEFSDIEECVKWMVPFAMAIKEVGSSTIKQFRGVPAEDLHNIQMHINTFELLDKVQAKQAMLAEKNRSSPLPTGVLTPPQSSKKLSQISKQL
ncbi:hypothetical protein JD844_000348 [Phrynosoma platyrhinos]|uniref:Cyclin C-terminal domain-containing protein n=1 Tax=Phrynosoma platyrhinos TaxID=52577 RepID=A0ABQ7SQF8_PHRPL|nr:hypothetical protein JD844_000348 [Phrynosoma platyrhinos]